MLHRYINQFVEYCQLADFSVRSIQALAIRLNEFEAFMKSQRIQSVKKITYLRLIDFVADYKAPSIHVRKSRVWTLRQFYHFLTLHRHVPQNIALKLPYPKIEDIDLTCGLIWIREKGRRRRNLILPHSLCKIIHKYLQLRRRKKGLFLISKRKKRISQRTLQDIFGTAADRLSIDKKLHARLFRHTAATHLNKVAGIEITQHVLGHSRRANTLKYAHLNPDKYAVYMKQHPFMQKETL
jgi:integrase/recombinase XerC